MIKKGHTPLKRSIRGTEILRRQASKRATMLSKYREGPIYSTLLKAGDAVKGRIFRASDITRNQRLLMPSSVTRQPKNWFMRFLDRARDILYDPNSTEMVRLKIRYEYDLSLRTVEEYYEL